MPELLFLIIAVIVIALIGRAVHRHGKKVDERWNQAANSLGLEFSRGGTFGKRTLEGDVEGNRVKVDVHSKGSGQSRHTVTRYEVYYPQPLGLGLRLKKEAAFYGVARFFGAQDIQVGDAEFDENVVVKGAQPSRVIDFLTPSRRLRILRMFQTLDGSEVQDSKLTWSSNGVEKNPSRMAATVRRMVRVANHLSGSAEEGRPLDQAMEAQHEGRLEEALELVRQSPGEAVDPDSRALEGEILYAARRFKEAARAFREGIRAAPEDEGLKAWAHRAAEKTAAVAAGAAAVVAGAAQVAAGRGSADTDASSHGDAGEEVDGSASPETEATVEEAVPEAAASDAGSTATAGEAPEAVEVPAEADSGTIEAAAPEASPTVETAAAEAVGPPRAEKPREEPAQDIGPDSRRVCRELFDPKIISLEANRRFEERYQDRQVRWSGTLRQARGYTFDMVFGSEPGTKLVVELHEIEGGAFARTVQAVVQLPAGMERGLEARKGQEIAFEGRLTSCDAFMRNLFVTGGRLLEEAS